MSIQRGKKDAECLLQPRQSFNVTFFIECIILGVKGSLESREFLLIPAFTSDQNSTIGFKENKEASRYTCIVCSLYAL